MRWPGPAKSACGDLRENPLPARSRRCPLTAIGPPTTGPPIQSGGSKNNAIVGYRETPFLGPLTSALLQQSVQALHRSCRNSLRRQAAEISTRRPVPLCRFPARQTSRTWFTSAEWSKMHSHAQEGLSSLTSLRYVGILDTVLETPSRAPDPAAERRQKHTASEGYGASTGCGLSMRRGAAANRRRNQRSWEASEPISLACQKRDVSALRKRDAVPQLRGQRLRERPSPRCLALARQPV